MGLERLAAVVQGVTSNYETDVFKELIEWIEDCSEKKYGENERHDVAFRIISDHARAAAFLIGDGIMPLNEGRGYVLRRIIRRALRFGKVLGMEDLFFRPVCSKVVETMGEDYKELIQSKSFIEGIIENEEKRFADTLHYSMKVLEEEIDKLKAKGSDTIPGEVAFKLYDTYGLSLDIVEDVARDENLRVDTAGYEEAMSRQKAMSQESWKGSGEDEIPKAYRSLLTRGLTSSFLGYETVISTAKVIAVVVEGKEATSAAAEAQAEVVLDQTPFYGEAGGQAGDTGLIVNRDVRFRVKTTLKLGQNLIVHKGHLETGSLFIGDEVNARVDDQKRNATALNHTATHLLHAALREVLGDHVKQAGSLVSPDRLRFDFSHFTQVPQERLVEAERLVNKHIRNNLPVHTTETSKEEALETGAMAIFEERYGERVRLVRIGDGVSLELCGGTHTGRTGDIGLFRIVSESAVAANVRRIEALTGEGALLYDQKQDKDLRFAASLLKTAPSKVGERLERLLIEHKEKDREIQSLNTRLLSQKSEDLISEVKDIGGIRVLARQIEAGSPKELREAGDRIKDKLHSGIILLGAKKEGKVLLTCVVTKDLVDRFKAGDIIKRLSNVVGGTGGGRPDMAQGGGNQPNRLERAFEALYELVKKEIS
jgi:alanyl-tRNA synthetase